MLGKRLRRDILLSGFLSFCNLSFKTGKIILTSQEGASK
jgi:hypothetical protein